MKEDKRKPFDSYWFVFSANRGNMTVLDNGRISEGEFDHFEEELNNSGVSELMDTLEFSGDGLISNFEKADFYNEVRGVFLFEGQFNVIVDSTDWESGIVDDWHLQAVGTIKPLMLSDTWRQLVEKKSNKEQGLQPMFDVVKRSNPTKVLDCVVLEFDNKVDRIALGTWAKELLFHGYKKLSKDVSDKLKKYGADVI